MAIKLFDEVGGIITLRLKGVNQERLINMALTRGIYIWDIKWHGEYLHLRVRSSAFHSFQSIADENGYELEIIARRGLPFYKKVMKRRMGFLVGAVIFILTLYLMSSFIWFIEVDGNKKLDSQEIMSSAAHNGIYVGAAKWNFNCNEVEEAILRQLSQISYVQCDVRGVKAKIKVVEKVFPDGEITGPCHIVAAKDGVIEDILVLEGQANVKPGQVAGKGDILISGIVFPSDSNAMEESIPTPVIKPYLVRARGTVKARTWYEGYGECPLKVESKIFTGRETVLVFFKTPWKQITLKGNKPDYALYKIEKRISKLNTPLGQWGIVKRILREQKIIIKEYSEEEAVELARERGVKKLRQKMQSNWQISDSRIEVLSSPSDSITRIKVSIECIEDITQTQAINVDEISN